MMPTKIEWTEYSWNPIRARNRETGRVGSHCVHATPGCENCYAEAINHRLGTGLDFAAWNREKAEVYLDEKTLTQPLRWKRPRRIFVCSMTDLFGEWVTDEMLDRIFAVMALCPHHVFQVLSKRAERMRDYASAFATPGRIGRHLRALAEAKGNAFTLWRSQDRLIHWPLANVWKGISAEDQRRADERIPLLLDTPAAVRWVSAEPLLGPVDLTSKVYDYGNGLFGDALKWHHLPYQEPRTYPKINWVVVGGESGPGARPMELRWVHDVVSQCQAEKIPIFVKQIGARPVVGGQTYTYYNGGPVDVKPRDRKGGDMAEWPSGLRVREYPTQEHA